MRGSLELIFIVISTFNRLVIPLHCPSITFIEPSQDAVIDCKILEGHDVYWYKGRIPGRNLIAKLERGKVEIIQDKQHYGLNEYGSLIVKDVKDELYGFYSVLVYDPDYAHSTNTIELRFAVKPPTNCPIFNSCMKCHGCNLTGSSGSSSCSLTKTRPVVDTEVFVEYNDGYSVVFKKQEQIHDPVTDTWNTTSVVQYDTHSCGASILFRCVSKDGHPFNLSESFVNVQSASCDTTIKDSTFPMYGIWTVIAVLALGVLGLAFVVRKKVLSSSPNESNEAFKMSHLTEMIDRRNDAVHRLVEGLVDEYEAYRFSNCLPNGQSISKDAIFTGIYFVLSDDNDHNEDMSSGPYLIKQFFEEIYRVVLVVGDEFLTKALLYYASSRLVRRNTDQEIIFILDLEGLNRKMCLADAIVSKLKLDGKITIHEVKDILENCRCLVVVKGVEGLTIDEEEIEKSNDSNKKDELTIEDLLKNLHCLLNYRKLRCLVLAKTGGYWKNIISNQYIRAQIDKFIPQNLKRCVSDIFKYYNTLSESIDKTPQGDDEENYKNEAECLIEYVFDVNNIIEKIGLSQSMLILFFHIVVSDIMQNKSRIKLSEVCLYRRSYLIETILYCFEFQYPNSSDHTATFNELKMVLGRAGLPQGGKNNPFTKASTLTSEFSVRTIQDERPSINLKDALLIGFLKSSNEHDVTSEECAVSLCDNVIQEHLTALVITSENLLNNLLKSLCWSENERMRQVLQLIYGNTPGSRQQIVEKLLKEKKWNILIDCLFESDNERDFEMITAKNGTVHEVKVSELDRHSHRLAVSRFCKILATNKVRLRELSFKGYWSREWFMQLKIPQVEKVAFIQMDFSHQKDYNDALQFCAKHNVKLHNFSFPGCDLPVSQKQLSESKS
ncbi:hypothetical protein HOLleu_17007 [Holothuria leucospilota]|uniref:Uncharacterized protein n=1 Tax=Holothuria leucospilota TaxID=206669 RepID=A0A9Q1HBG1_HOLLE|nr:hypothetical protein HOLleu_17007 [Holothuria leucospilota]